MAGQERRGENQEQAEGKYVLEKASDRQGEPGPIGADPLADETAVLRTLLPLARQPQAQNRRVAVLARRLVKAARAGRRQFGGVDAFMHEYALSSEEGVVLMCLAEALLRIPDAETADRLIADKIGGKEWQRHLGASHSLFVNASTWGLMLGGRVVDLGASGEDDAVSLVKRFVARSGEPVIRQAMRQAMRILGGQFVLGRTIEEALARAGEQPGYLYSYDMLGEAAMTRADAARYLDAYRHAIARVAESAGGEGGRPGISVKLSALHPRFESSRQEGMAGEVLPGLLDLARQARAGGVMLTIDAEEMERLELTLKLFARLALDSDLAGWDGLGLAVQAYGRRALPILKWLAALARKRRCAFAVRLVKGAYWDREIKQAQQLGLESFPVFTRKSSTDVSYLACARFLLSRRDMLYPQFATHNAHTVAAVRVMAGESGGFEYQRLHGMGRALYDKVLADRAFGAPCRIYAPVGAHEDLLAYLVRRLLENGANASFVNRLADDAAPAGAIIADPVAKTAARKRQANPAISAPADLFAPGRRNSAGLALYDDAARRALLAEMAASARRETRAGPIVGGRERDGAGVARFSPHDRRVEIGRVSLAESSDLERAVQLAAAAQPGWDRLGGEGRAEALERAADLFEANRAGLMALLVREGGKTLGPALAEVREAVDYLRYYAMEARRLFSAPAALPGPTGEANSLRLAGRGVFACISPWNFPLAIFTGQIAAALAAGNAVVAKPAGQTPLTGAAAVRLLLEAGVPGDVVHFLPGGGATIGAALVADRRIGGVCFTGSNETAAAIASALAARGGPLTPLIAETGGLNAMILDSSALPEQAVRDCLASAFDSAGQRCSALRILYVQDEAAGRVVTMLRGAMEELRIGDPFDFETDIGPVIDEAAREALEAHKSAMRQQAREIADLALPGETRAGTYVGPAAYELDDPARLTKEIFGPILHVVRYQASRLDEVCEAINAAGYGLTLGIHSRVGTTIERVLARVRVGNAYVNRNQIGAVVGSQPFGGEGLSGTGPKAGGPHYLPRLALERVVSTDTTAAGGNTSLLSLGAGGGQKDGEEE